MVLRTWPHHDRVFSPLRNTMYTTFYLLKDPLAHIQEQVP